VAYTITLSNGTVLTTVANETIDSTHTSLQLIGRNYPGYGEQIANDLVHLLEHFSNTTAPTTPLTGQLWWNSGTEMMEVWTGTEWIMVGFPADGVLDQDVTIYDHSLIFVNSLAPINRRKWRIRVSNTSPYIGMLVFEALNDDNTVRNTVMALDGVTDLINGVITAAEYS
jgi:hypothetical protein